MENTVIEDSENPPPRRGPKPKRLIKVEVLGYEVGRGKTKRIVFDDDVYKLAQLGCTDREIAQWFDMSESTLRYNFSAIMEKARSELKQTLRRAQIKYALEGSNALLIWLGKQYLQQSDTPNMGDSKQILPFTDDAISDDEDKVKIANDL